MAVAKPRKDLPDPASGSPGACAPGGEGRSPSFEERLEALESVVQDLEGEDLPLERSLQRYREGVEHLKACRALLDDAERRLAELVAQPGPNGEITIAERSLEVGEKGLTTSTSTSSGSASGTNGGGATGGDVAKRPGASRKPAANGDDIPF